MTALVVLCGLGAKAQLTDGTVYWIQDASTGQFLSQGNDWGTQATVKDVGGLGFEVVYVSDGVYKLKNIMWNKVNNADLGLRATDGYCDQAASDVTLTVSGEGYTIKNTEGKYLCNNGDVNDYGVKPRGFSDDASSATVWKFLTKAEYEAAIQAYKDGKAADYATQMGLTASNVTELEAIITDPTQYLSKDLTNKISNPTLGSNWEGWTHASPNQRGEGAGVGSGCAEFWDLIVFCGNLETNQDSFFELANTFACN